MHHEEDKAFIIHVTEITHPERAIGMLNRNYLPTSSLKLSDIER